MEVIILSLAFVVYSSAWKETVQIVVVSTHQRGSVSGHGLYSSVFAKNNLPKVRKKTYSPDLSTSKCKSYLKMKKISRGNTGECEKAGARYPRPQGYPGILPSKETTMDKVFHFRRWLLRKRLNMELLCVIVFLLQHLC